MLGGPAVAAAASQMLSNPLHNPLNNPYSAMIPGAPDLHHMTGFDLTAGYNPQLVKLN